MSQWGTITMDAGTTLPVTITVTDDGLESGTPVDLTGATASFVIARGFGGTAIVEKDETDMDLTGDTDGIAVVTLEPADTEDLAGLYVYWLQVTLDDESVITPVRGRLVVQRTVAPVP